VISGDSWVGYLVQGKSPYLCHAQQEKSQQIHLLGRVTAECPSTFIKYIRNTLSLIYDEVLFY
jgi:hypothetical protein